MITFSRDPNYPKEMVGAIHCQRCLKETPDGWHISQWEDLEVGLTVHGMQVWCRRHDCNVEVIDFPTVQRQQTAV